MSNEKPRENKSKRKSKPICIPIWWLIIAVLIGIIGTLIVLSLLPMDEGYLAYIPDEVQNVEYSVNTIPQEAESPIFVIYLSANRYEGNEDTAAFSFSTEDARARLTAFHSRLTAFHLVYEEVEPGVFKNDKDRLDYSGYERIAWTRVRQQTPFRGTREEAFEHAMYNMGGMLFVDMQVVDLFNCLIWRNNVRQEGNEIILTAFGFWHEVEEPALPYELTNPPIQEPELPHLLPSPPTQEPELTTMLTNISNLFFEGNTVVTTERGTNATMRVDVDSVNLGGMAHPDAIVFESNHDGLGGFSFTLVHFALFNLGRNYKTLTGYFGRTEGSVAHPAIVRFFGDDSINYFYKFEINPMDFPVQLTLDVEGIRMLRVEVEYSRIVSVTGLNRTRGLVAFAFAGQVE